MTSTRVAFLVLVAVFFINVAQIGYYWPQLPPRVVSSFDLRGRPGDEMSKTPFVLAQAGLMLGMVAMPPLIGFLVPRLPAKGFSVQHRDYWLAPEHRPELNRITCDYLSWMVAATSLFLTAIFELAYLANLGHPQIMRQWPEVLTGIFLLGILVLVVGVYRRLSRIPPGSPTR